MYTGCFINVFVGYFWIIDSTIQNKCKNSYTKISVALFVEQFKSQLTSCTCDSVVCFNKYLLYDQL